MEPTMTATLIAFPTPFERDNMEFDRTEASNYTRAITEGAALWSAVMAAGSAQGLEQRISAYAAAIDHLRRYRPEDLGNLVIMDDNARIELNLLPDLLSAMVGQRSK